MLSLGMQSADVLAWQNALRAHGYEVVPDGIYGPATQAATRKLQSDLGVTPDGIVGPATLSAYQSRYAETAVPITPRSPTPPLWAFGALAAVAVFILLKNGRNRGE